MKENLEKYLKEKRLRLDTEEPESDLIWEGIRGGMQTKRKTLPEWFWKVAAIFIFAAFVSYYVVNENSQEKVVIVTLSDISEDLGTRENKLKQLVNLKWEEVQSQLPAENTNLQFLFDELNQLDEVYNIYQKDLNNTLNNEPVIRAMLDYYEKKIKILNRLLLEIEKQDYHEKTITL